MPNKILSYLKFLGAVITSTITICGGLWLITKPHIDDYVKSQVIEYVKSPEYKNTVEESFKEFLTTSAFVEALDNYLERVNSNSVSLRHLLSIKMGVPQESVADEISKMYNRDRKRLYNVLRAISRMYPELQLWQIDE